MNQAASLHVASRTAIDRYQVAFAKNPNCVVCEKRIEDPRNALLLPQNDRLAHPGACSAEALRHQFAYARHGLKGRRSHRGAR